MRAISLSTYYVKCMYSKIFPSLFENVFMLKTFLTAFFFFAILFMNTSFCSLFLAWICYMTNLTRCCNILFYLIWEYIYAINISRGVFQFAIHLWTHYFVHYFLHEYLTELFCTLKTFFFLIEIRPENDVTRITFQNLVFIFAVNTK